MNLASLASRNIEVVGDTTYRGPCAVEDAELITFRNQLEQKYPQYAAVMLHPKNEGKRLKFQADAERAKGALNTGASDIIIPGYPALVIELKRCDHMQSKITLEQLDYLEDVQKIDCWAFVALGWAAAMEVVDRWHEANYV